MHCIATSEPSSPARMLISRCVVSSNFWFRVTISNAVSPWYQIDMGSRPQPKTGEAIENWAGIPSDRGFLIYMR